MEGPSLEVRVVLFCFARSLPFFFLPFMSPENHANIYTLSSSRTWDLMARGLAPFASWWQDDDNNNDGYPFESLREFLDRMGARAAPAGRCRRRE